MKLGQNAVVSSKPLWTNGLALDFPQPYGVRTVRAWRSRVTEALHSGAFSLVSGHKQVTMQRLALTHDSNRALQSEVQNHCCFILFGTRSARARDCAPGSSYSTNALYFCVFALLLVVKLQCL
jgi:hypothetical protein